MLRLLLYLAIAGVLAFLGATAPLGKKTFFEHVKAIWSSEPMNELKEGVKETAGPATDKAKDFVRGGVDAVRKGSGSVGSAEEPRR